MFPMAMGISEPGIIAVAVIALILFGGSKVGEFMKSAGQGVKEFKKAVKDEDAPTGSDASSAPADPKPTTTDAKA